MESHFMLYRVKEARGKKSKEKIPFQPEGERVMSSRGRQPTTDPFDLLTE